MKINPYKSNARYVAITGMMLALAVVLTTLESQFSAFLPAGVRIGLSNIVIMTALLSINAPTALIITILKSVFVLLTRGVTAGMMSVCGGLAAFLVTWLLFRHTSSSYVMVSVISAVAHIIGQLCMASVLTGSVYTFYYAPLLLIVGIASGVCTGIVLDIILKRLSGLHEKNSERIDHIK